MHVHDLVEFLALGGLQLPLQLGDIRRTLAQEVPSAFITASTSVRSEQGMQLV